MEHRDYVSEKVRYITGPQMQGENPELVVHVCRLRLVRMESEYVQIHFGKCFLCQQHLSTTP
jgi:hypothetical protein